ncbi:hypothetical protein HQ590_11910 [bacterium]|nr:hypothetical protein [bacterium]
MRYRIVAAALLWFTASAVTIGQGPFTPRTADLPSDDLYPYVPVSLDPVANDTQAVPFPTNRLLFQKSIPFDLPTKDAANCLFLKPMGWTDSQVGGYVVAKYDDWHEAIKDPRRALVRVPVGDYKAIWLLAATDGDTNLSEILTMRLGVADGQGPVIRQDIAIEVPRANAASAGVIRGADLAAIIPTDAGKMYLLRVPFARAVAEDLKAYRTLWLEFTKELRTAVNLPDPFRYDVRPLGVPSGVRIYAVTLERAPLQLKMVAAEPGNVFNEPQTPTFRLELANVLNEHYILYDIQTEAIADDGTVVQQTITNAFRSWSWKSGRDPIIYCTFRVPVPKRGLYQLQVSLLARGKDLVNSRQTTFALLAPDTRQHRDESPFGTWDFAGGHVSPSDWDLRGPLYVKAGLRYVGLHDRPASIFQKYGLLAGGDVEPGRIFGDGLQALQEQLKTDPEQVPPTRFLVFHEHGVSGSHLTRTPDLFTGKTYRMSAEEEKTFSNHWAKAAAAVPAIRAAFPKAEIYFGNTTPHLLEEFLRRGWPVEDLGAIGNESGCFMHLPEAQPTDYIAGNSCLWMLRQIADHYGAQDVPLRQCLEICYPGTGPGNLTEMTQAAYLVRHNMHFLAWKIPVIRPMCLTDMANSYYHSQWGAAGLCHAWPDASPKPAYVAFAVQTLLLDGASFSRWVPTGSTVVYAAEFKKQDKTYVTVCWTLRGTRLLTIDVRGSSKARLTNLMGRESAVAVTKRQAVIEVSDRPCYLSTRRAIAAIQPGQPVHETKPGEKSFVISSLDKLDEWTIQTNRDTELEAYNFMRPRRQGQFQYQEVTGPPTGSTVLQVAPQLPVEGSSYLPMYSGLTLKKPVEIPGQPTQIGLLVNGNGGWGRIIFELEDASGQRWISIGAEQAGAPNPWLADWLSPEEFAKLNPNSMNVSDWNSDDAWGRSYINFDGWRLLKFPLPGQYPGAGYHWPMNSQWRFSGDGVVRYPLRFKRLVITMPEKVLYGTQYIAPRRYEIALKDLVAMYEPVEKVFAGE